MNETALTASLYVFASDARASLLQVSPQGTRADPSDKDQEEPSGDSVRISEQGQALAAGLAAAGKLTTDAADAAAASDSGGQAKDDADRNSGSDSGSSSKQADSIEKQIDSLKEQVDEIKNDDSLDDQERADQVLTLQTQIAQLEIQLQTLEARNSPDVSAGMTAAETYGAMT